jgi:hypothetical protein
MSRKSAIGLGVIVLLNIALLIYLAVFRAYEMQMLWQWQPQAFICGVIILFGVDLTAFILIDEDGATYG